MSAVEDCLPEEARETSGALVTDGSYDMRGAIARLADRAKSEITERAKEELREVTRIIAIAVSVFGSTFLSRISQGMEFALMAYWIAVWVFF